jgi:ribosomal protein S18 acetylase RimI-like enzyme
MTPASIRPTVPADTPALLALTEGTGLFLPRDIEALDSVLKSYHEQDKHQGHISITTVQDGAVIGFAYYAPAPMTDRTWHLWWIAVSKQIQSRGVGGQLLRQVEEGSRAANARLLMVETSSLPSYELTRRFYVKNGYTLAAVLKDYYEDNHDMVIFRKRLIPVY